MNIQFLDIVNLITPFLGGAVGWFVGRKRQKNDFLNELQASVDLLAGKNKQLIEEVVKLREENAEFRYNLDELTRKLQNVKIITKKINPDEKN